jgi:glycosyltransferase involved in cell wall biosynthesis
MSRPGPIDRARQLQRLLRSEGIDGVAQRLGARVADRLTPTIGHARLPVSMADLARAGEIATGGWELPPALPAREGEPLTIAWVSAPTTADAGSGGHTTMFRQIEALERAGHRCVLYFSDPHGWSLEQHRTTMRTLRPAMRAEVRDATGGIEDAHAIFATSWETAYPVLASHARGVRCYFVQDFEPWFYPAGSEALLAEATYRFGFHGVTAGRWLADMLTRDYGMTADHFDFGCDLGHYRLDPAMERTGICYYARFTKPRRAFELGLAALELFAARHPGVDIHLYGDDVPRLPFRAINHGTLGPEQLNDVYNRCVAGLALSATNVSLVPHEMLAAGCLPVVNDAEHNRIVLDNSEVVYVPPTPFELADALSALIERPATERDAAAAAAAGSVQSRSWDDAGLQVERAVRNAVTTATRALTLNS